MLRGWVMSDLLGFVVIAILVILFIGEPDLLDIFKVYLQQGLDK